MHRAGRVYSRMPTPQAYRPDYSPPSVFFSFGTEYHWHLNLLFFSPPCSRNRSCGSQCKASEKHIERILLSLIALVPIRHVDEQRSSLQRHAMTPQSKECWLGKSSNRDTTGLLAGYGSILGTRYPAPR
jgi:hypothetical protein